MTKNIVRLSDAELVEVTNIISGYTELHDQITKLEDTLKQMMEVKTTLLTNLNEKRQIEKKMTQRFERKYGKGRLDPQTLEWITK